MTENQKYLMTLTLLKDNECAIIGDLISKVVLNLPILEKLYSEITFFRWYNLGMLSAESHYNLRILKRRLIKSTSDLTESDILNNDAWITGVLEFPDLLKNIVAELNLFKERSRSLEFMQYLTSNSFGVSYFSLSDQEEDKRINENFKIFKKIFKKQLKDKIWKEH